MAEDIFKNLTTEEPDREDEIDDDVLSGKSATEAENTSPNDSDLESTLKRLFPSFDEPEIKGIAQVIMLGRVFPDNFSRKIYLIVCAIAKAHRHDKDFNVVLTMMKIEGLAQIGLDGKGRVEAVIVSGNTKEQAEQEARPSGF
jgi:hypothetical protein